MPKLKKKTKKVKSLDRKVKFDMNLPAPSERSTSRNAAKGKLTSRMEADYVRSSRAPKGGRGPKRPGIEIPETKLTQDTKTGEYIATAKLSSPANMAKGGKVKAKKDACYHKVKARYSVWPSAYASGALAKCRKVGAANWGKKSKK